MSPATRGVVVVVAGFGITVALGSLYVWVLIAAELLRPLSAGGVHGWTVPQVSLPFAVAAGSFVLAMLVGGFVQDRIGPRWTSTAGGVLIGLGMIVASMAESRLGASSSLAAFMVLGLGLMVGGGAGLTFASVVPPAVKWSVPRRRGLVVGLVLAGIALGPLWLNDAVQAFVRERGFSSVLLMQGIALLALIVALSQVLEDPLPGYVPPGSYAEDEDPDDGPVPWAGLSLTAHAPNPLVLRALGRLRAARRGDRSARRVAARRVLADGPGRARPRHRRRVECRTRMRAGGRAAGPRGAPGNETRPPVAGGRLGLSGGPRRHSAILRPQPFLIAASGGGGVVATWVSVLECFGTRYAGANFGLAFTGWCLGLLLGALVALAPANMVLGGMAGPAERNLMVGVLVVTLGGAAVLFAQVRPSSGREALHKGLPGRSAGRES